MMQSFQDRKDLISYLLSDPAPDAKFVESLGLLYKWYRYENALRKAAKYKLLSEKLAKPLEEEIEILLFRRNLNNIDVDD